MYTREEASRIRHEFWTAFGKYMSPVLSADGLKCNWLNYKTGIKNIYFRMDADGKKAKISIEITHSDLEIQRLVFEKFNDLKPLLTESVGEEWDWQLHAENDHKIVTRIIKQVDGVSVFNKNDWPQLISFFKPRIIALDEFWSGAKYGFEEFT